jgi:hypothetical protein
MVFEPLLIAECWEQFVQASGFFKSGSSQSIIMRLESVDMVDSRNGI